MGQELAHWALAGESEPFTGPLAESVTLAPVLTDTALAVFVTQGSEVEPQTGTDGFLATAPENDPTRDGYAFDGWSSNEDGTGDFNFEATPIEGTVFIYARWVAAETDYTLNIWVEKANAGTLGNPLAGERAGYELKHTTTRTGTTGDEVALDADEARELANGTTGDVKNLLTYSTFEVSENKALSAGGDTVINVFFTRTEFTFNFDVSAYKDGDILLPGGASAGKTYQLKVKVEQDVSSLWPEKVELGKGTYFVNWSQYYGLGAQTVSYSYISTAFSNPKGVVTPYYYDITTPLRWSATLKPTVSTNPYTETRYYYTELSADELARYEAAGRPGNLDGVPVREWSTSHTTYGGARYYKLAVTSITSNQNSNPAANSGGYPIAKGWPGRDIPGYETIGSRTSGLACTTLQFMEIVSNGGRDYSLNYFMPSKSGTLTLKTGAGAIENPDPALSPESGGYTAKLAYKAALDAIVPTDVSRLNYTFEGWYLDEHFEQPFTGGTMPAGNLTLYAKYRGTEVSVTYTDGEEVITNHYARDDKLNSHDLAGTPYQDAKIGDVIPGKGIFRGWYYDVGQNQTATVAFPLGLTLSRDSYVLKAQLSPLTYLVTFKGNEDGETVSYGQQEVRSGASNTLARSGHTALAPTREGFELKGWSLTPGGNANFSTATRILEDTTVYAIWAPVQITLTFDPNGGTLSADGQHTLNHGQSLADTGVAAPGEEEVALEAHRFLGWFTQAQGGEAFDPATKLTGDTTVFAHWDAIKAPTGPDTPKPNPTDPTDPTVPTVPTPPTGPVAPPPAAPTPGEPLVSGDTLMDDPTVQARLDQQTGNPVTDILDGNVPMGSPATRGAWSLLSLMMALGGLVISIPQFALLFRRRKQAADEEEAPREDAQTPRATRRSRLLKILAIAAGLLAGVLFLILDNMALPMAFLNQWTLWVAIPFVAQLLLLAAQLIKRRDEEDDETPAPQAQ